MQNSTLSERAILVRLSIGLPGENRQDPSLSQQVKSEHNLGTNSGRWVKALWPTDALKAIKSLDNEARAFHAAVTLPYDSGIGILAAGLIQTHSDRMRQYKDRRSVLVEKFLNDAQQHVEWAMREHNGTFNPDYYPGCKLVGTEATPDNVAAVMLGDKFIFDADEFRRVMAEKFTFRTEVLPVPAACHFSDTVASLLGTDLESVDQRVKDAEMDGARELLRRMMEPVRAMAQKLVEQPKVKANGKQAEDIVFRDTLVTNLQDIAKLAPQMNLTGDPEINKFAREIGALTIYSPDKLREDKDVRKSAAQKAADLFKRLEGYKL